MNTVNALYTAMVFTGEVLELYWDLEALLALVADLQGEPGNEDVCIWHRGQVVCVVRDTGDTVWLLPSHRPAPRPRPAA
jgi:hypothetical protein